MLIQRRAANLKDLLSDDTSERTDNLPPIAQTTNFLQQRETRENMKDFIDMKRELFLVQLDLDTKRDEIRKLEEKSRQKEEALVKSEEMLEEDAKRFDTFLKENDKKCHEAIRR